MNRFAGLFWFISLTVLAPRGRCFLETLEGQKFFQKYVQKHDVDAVNIFINKHSSLSIADRQRFISSLGLPFLVYEAEADSTQAFPGEVSDAILGIAYMETPSDLRFLQKLAKDDLFRTMNWVIIGDPKTLSPEDVYAPYFALDNKVVFAKWINRTILSIELTETYQAAKYLPYIVNFLGLWTERGGLTILEGDASARRTNLTGLHLRCVTLEQAPFTYLRDGVGEGVTYLSRGYIKDIWEILKSNFHFTYSCKKPSDNSWGTLKDGKWNGLVRELHDKTADVIVTSLDYTTERANAVDFLQGTRVVSYRMIVRKPGLMDSTWTSFTSELGIDSWIVLICMVLTVPLLLAFTSHYSPCESWTVPLQDAYLLILGALFFQGSWVNVSSTSSRMVFIIIFLVTFLIYAHYTSALVAQLTVASDKSTPFTTLQGLLEDGGYNLGFLKDISLEEYFQRATSSPYRELWNDIISKTDDNRPDTVSTGLNKVKEENYVYLMEENIFNFEYSNECGLMMLPNEYFKTMTSIAFTKNSPYVKAFNYHLNKLRDSGVLERFWKRWQPPKSLCEDILFIALSIDQTSTAFLVLLFGVLLATFICLPMERISRFASSSLSSSSSSSNEVVKMSSED